MASGAETAAAVGTAPETPANHEAEIVLGRAVAIAVPTVSVLMAILVGLTVGLGPAILILAGGGIVGTISLLWASVRTLSGDAPLAEGLTSAVSPMTTAAAVAADRKRAALRALKDLEFERSVGKIDQADYEDLVLRYRTDAKTLMREMDHEIEPFRARAERIAQTHLAKVGLIAGAANEGSVANSPPPLVEPSSEDDDDNNDDPGAVGISPRAESRLRHRVSATPSNIPVTPFGAPLATQSRVTELLPEPRFERVPCVKCTTSNEADAAFCKKCGAGLRPECGSCHAKNEPDAAFCKRCGAKLAPPPDSVPKVPDAAS